MQKEFDKKGGFCPSYALNNRNNFNCFGFPVFQVTGVCQPAKVKTHERKCLTFIIR